MANNNLINRKHVKDYILKRAAQTRLGWPCNRVSKQALEDINIRLRILIDRAVHSHPTIGQTFKVVQ